MKINIHLLEAYIAKKNKKKTDRNIKSYMEKPLALMQSTQTTDCSGIDSR